MAEWRSISCRAVLYRQYGQAKQLVVPQAARDVVLTFGQLIPWVGHLGNIRPLLALNVIFSVSWSEPRGSPVLQELLSVPKKALIRGNTRVVYSL